MLYLLVPPVPTSAKCVGLWPLCFPLSMTTYLRYTEGINKPIPSKIFENARQIYRNFFGAVNAASLCYNLNMVRSELLQGVQQLIEGGDQLLASATFYYKTKHLAICTLKICNICE